MFLSRLLNSSQYLYSSSLIFFKSSNNDLNSSSNFFSLLWSSYSLAFVWDFLYHIEIYSNSIQCFLFYRRKQISCAWPMELENFFWCHKSYKLDYKTKKLISFNLINIYSCSSRIVRELFLTSLKYFFGISVYCKLSLMRFKIYSVKFDDFSINNNLLMRNWSLFHNLCVKELYSIFSWFFFLKFIHTC